MNVLINYPELLIASALIAALVMVLSSIGLILTSGHQNYEPVISQKRKFKGKQFGVFDRAIKVNGCIYYREVETDIWLDECVLDSKELEQARTLIIEEMDSKPWLAYQN